MAGTRLRVVVRHALVGSVLTWTATGITTLCIHFFVGRGWASALQVACWVMIVLSLAYGAVGLGGGVIALPTRVFRSFQSESRERVTDDPGGLTPLGLALFVVPQLFLVAALIET